MARMRIPELVVPGRRLGRHINHDPRSLRFLVPETSSPATTTWKRILPVLNQGDLGSCTGNAMTGVLGSEVCYDALSAAQRTALGEQFAVDIYSRATVLDGYPGTYKPDDTGSDGLSAAKAVKEKGYASGYQHMTSLAAMHSAIQAAPFACGFSWYSGFDNPDSQGKVTLSGQVRGGHEWEFLNYNATTGLWECVNSWGDSWGKGGHFFISDEDVHELLAEQGDATSLVPISAPTPTPTPTPTPPGDALADFPFPAVDPWAHAPHVWHSATDAARAYIAWKTRHGR